MKEISSLIDYLKIICSRPLIADTSDYVDNWYLAKMNEAVKEFEAKVISFQTRDRKRTLRVRNL